MFQVPIPELEYEWAPQPLRHVPAGSTVTLDQNDSAASFVVAENKTGPKWTTLLDKDGKIIVRAEPDSTISWRKATEESREAASNALRTNRVNKRLRERRAEFKPNEQQLLVLAELTEAAQAGQMPSSFTTSDLLSAQASDIVAARFNRMVEHALEKDKNADLQDLMRRAREVFKEDILRRARNDVGLSRSTSVISNAMDDALLAATARFVDDAEYDV